MNKNKFLLFAGAICISAISFAQPTIQWQATHAGPFDVTANRSIGMDASGNIYTGGNYWNGSSLDYTAVKYNSSGTQQWAVTYNSGANEDLQRTRVDAAGNVYLCGYGSFGGNNNFRTVKYNTAGTQQWVAVYNNPANRDDYVASMEIDNAGNVYVTGYCDQGGGFYDIVTVKYNSAGAQQWASSYRIAPSTYNIAQDVSVDAAGNVYVTGYSQTGAGYDIMTIQYNSAGTQQWVRQFGVVGRDDMPADITVDAAGDIYVAGRQNNGSNWDGVVIKYNSAGTQQWTSAYATAASDYPVSLIVNAVGEAYYTGYNSGVGPNKAITVKINSSGVQQWANVYSAPSAIEDLGSHIVFGPTGNVIVTGHTRTAASGMDILLLSYNSAGSQLWVTSWTSPGNNTDQGYSSITDSYGNIYTNGIQHNGTDYDLKVFKFGYTKFYVDHTASGSNSGTSWANAFTDFQSAVASADAGDTVYVAEGIYKPSVGVARTKTFALQNGVIYLGAFPNGGGSLSSRNTVANPTILSGDIGNPIDSTDNCFVVVDATNLNNATTVGGFIIEEGNADSVCCSNMYSRAGGIHLGATGRITLDSVIIRNNFGRAGSAVYAEAPVNWIVQGCSFLNNNNGCAVTIGGNASGSFTNCIFTNNYGYNGGAILFNVLSATFTITNCQFTDNVGINSGGGGAISIGAAALTFNNCSFTNNRSTTGPGGACHKFYSTPCYFNNCTFVGNRAASGGGALYGQGGWNLTNCVFSQNQVTNNANHGGAIYNNGTPSTMNNCVFWGNFTSQGIGGAIYNNTGGTVTLTHCTFANNNAAGYTQGGGLNNNSNSNATITNCIFWGNLANGSDPASNTEIGHGSGTLNVTNTIWQGNTSGGTILNVNPLFVNQAAGNLALTICSPAIDTGSTVAVTQDILLQPRPFNAKPGTLDYDLGAYEFQSLVLVPEIDVLGNSVSIANGDITPSLADFTDFGSQLVCSGIVNRTFVIFNSGSAVLNLSAFTISGTNAADFTITSTASPTVNPPNGSTSFILTFNPSGSGVRTATVTIQNNDCNEAPYTFTVQGTGLDPEINVLGNAQSIPDGAPAPTPTNHTDFTSQSTCAGAFNRTFTIQNSGNTTLNITSLTIGGPNAADFTIITPPASTVLALNSTTFTIAFNPSANGLRSASIFINNDDCNEAIFDFAIQGTGIDPEVNIQGSSITIVDGDVTPAISDGTDFMAQSVCNGTVVRTFTIQNTGTQTLNISGVTITGAQASDFTVTSAPAATVTPSGSTTFQVTFDPSNFGNRNATVTVNSSDCDEPAYDFAITGFGTNVTFIVTSQTNVSCNGGATGAITISASGGISPYFYSWSPGNPTGNGTPSVSNLTAGTYTCTVSDFNGCTYSAPITVTSAPPIAIVPSQSDVTCYGVADGSATVVVSGGNPGYTYSWSPSGGTGSTATGLAPASYTVTITDATLCTATQTFNITEPTELILNTGTEIDVSCNGGSNGSVSVIASGGVGGNSFDWTPGNPTGDGTNTITGLIAGTYTCVVTNSNGCTASQIMFVTQPTPIVSNSTQIDVSCNGGSNGQMTVAPTGGTGPYTYSWLAFPNTTNTMTNAIAGFYLCTITDANGCTNNATFQLTEPSAITPNQMQNNITCNSGNNGHLMVSPSGGTGGYTYSWSPVASSFNVLNGSPAGFYTCTIADANGCTATATFNLTEPTAFSVTTMQTDLLCNGAATGDAMVMVSGSNPGYTYSWSPSGGTNATASALSAGTYSCTITDVFGCTTVSTVTLTEPSAISITSGIVPPTCFGGGDGAINIVTSGGTPGYTWLWSNMSTLESATSLTAGMYCVTVTDVNGCTFNTCLTVTEPPQITSTASTTDPTGCTTNDGVIDLSVTGGTGAFTFAWSNTATSEDISSIDGGTYSVTITDVNGCTHTDSYTLTEPDAPVVTYSEVVDTTCDTQAPWVLTSGNPLGGTWSGPGVNANTFDPTMGLLGFNVISYTYTDAGGCSGFASDSIWNDLCLDAATIPENTFTLYPNPTSAILNIVTNGDYVTIVVTDPLGQLVASVVSNSTTTQIDLAENANGLYFVRVEQNGSFTTQRLMIAK